MGNTDQPWQSDTNHPQLPQEMDTLTHFASCFAKVSKDQMICTFLISPSIINQIAMSVWPADVTWGFQVFAGQSGDHMMPWRRCQQAGLNGTRQRRTLANCCSKFPYLSEFLKIGWSSLGIFLDTLSRSRFHKWNNKNTWSEEVPNLRIFSSNSAFTWTCLKSKQPWAEQLTTRSTCSWDIKGFKSAACSWPLEVNGASHMLPQQHSLRSTKATWKQVSNLFEDS